MVESDRVRWNMHLVSHMFFEEEANLILSIPLSLLIILMNWYGLKNLNNIFRRRVHISILGLVVKFVVMNHFVRWWWWRSNFFWKALWCTQVPGKVKICIWRGCLNALPFKDNLKTRKVLTDDCCLFCDNERETIGHALLHCPRAMTIVWLLLYQGKVLIWCLFWFEIFGKLIITFFGRARRCHHRKSNFKLTLGSWNLRSGMRCPQRTRPTMCRSGGSRMTDGLYITLMVRGMNMRQWETLGWLCRMPLGVLLQPRHWNWEELPCLCLWMLLLLVKLLYLHINGSQQM